MQAGESFVSDGSSSVSYAQVREAAPEWDAWLQENGVSQRDCLALVTRSDVRSAAALLALLTRGQSVLLWRQPGSLPPFCRALLEDSGDHEAGCGPGGFRIVRGPQEPTLLPVETPYVYLPTSGTTGEPKIVAYAPSTLLGNARNCVSRLQLSSADRVMIPVPLAHMYGLGAAFLPSALVGASVRLIDEANLINYVSAEEEFSPTVAFLTPSFCHLLVKGRKQSRPYRLTVLAGDAADEQTFSAYEQRHGCTVNLYGSTELGVISAGSPDEPFEKRRETAGTPLPGVRLGPPEAEDEAEASGRPDQPFPLRFDHPFGCAGYTGADGHPVKPSSLYRDGWYYTRDLGRLDEVGRLQLMGRFDDTVKRDGVLVSFGDVERALQRLDAIERVVVVAGGTTPRGRELVAVCTAATPAVDSATMRRLALEVLPAHAVPDRFIFIEKLPLTATAKPDRLALAALVTQ